MAAGSADTVDKASGTKIAAVPGPTVPAARIEYLDVMRGFAMFGVLLAYLLWSLGPLPPERWTSLDRTLDAILVFAVDAKFYTILAFLFGVGFSLQLDRLDLPDAARFYRRRLLVLAGIGLVHALLLRNGDILLPYATVGLLLLGFRKVSNRAILITAFALVAYAPLARAAFELSGVPLPSPPATEGATFLAANLRWVGYRYSMAVMHWPPILTLFLFGLLAARLRLLARMAREPGLARIVAAVGLSCALLFFFARAWLIDQWEAPAPTLPHRLLASILFALHSWSLASFYTALLMLSLTTRLGAALVAPSLGSVGRMALTNYLAQAALIVPVCVAFDLFGKFTPTSSLLLALAMFFLVQVPLSRAWLRRFDHGPAEQLLRSLVYGKTRTPHLSSATPPGPDAL